MAARPSPELQLTTMDATYFSSAMAFRRWLASHHATDGELLVGFRNVGARGRGLTYREALDAALTFGWIDGVRRRIDDSAYSIRFSPRTSWSIWSLVNIRRMEELIAEGRVAPAGLAAYERRDEARSRSYSYEEQSRPLPPELEQQFRGDRRAGTFFASQPPSYRRATSASRRSPRRAPGSNNPQRDRAAAARKPRRARSSPLSPPTSAHAVHA